MVLLSVAVWDQVYQTVHQRLHTSSRADYQDKDEEYRVAAAHKCRRQPLATKVCRMLQSDGMHVHTSYNKSLAGVLREIYLEI